MSVSDPVSAASIRRRYLRPIKLATAFTLTAELLLLVVYGILLSDEGSLLYKILWTLGFCGLGMGMTVGALLDLLVVDRLGPRASILATTAIGTITLGIGCNALCMVLDRHYRYFGGAEDPYLHFLPSFFGSIAASWLLGWLLFSSPGSRLIDRLGID